MIISALGASSTLSHEISNDKVYNNVNSPSLAPARKSTELTVMDIQISDNDIWLSNPTDFSENTEQFLITFEPPQISESEHYSSIIVPECIYNTPGSAPIIPKRTITLTFPPGTEISSINFKPHSLNHDVISKPVLPALNPYPVIEGYTDNIPTQPIMDSNIYELNALYPSNWYDYTTGLGLSPYTNNRELILAVHIYPVRYNPATDEITYITSGELNVKTLKPQPEFHSRAGGSADTSTSREATHDMIILCPNNLKTNDLIEFAERKTGTGVDSIIVTKSEITGETYFPSQGDDEAEKIKYFIYNAVKEWDIKYVLLVGDIDQMPTRITHVNDGWPDVEASDLYFADVLDSSNNFCDWNYDNDNNYGEYDGSNIDHADLYPDVHLGRFPASSESELSTLIDKTLTYEYTAIGQEWFNNAILCGMDTFSGGTPEGEYLSDYIASHYLTDFEVTKLYETQGTLNTQAIKTNMNLGAGFASFSDHGTHSAWGGSEFSSSDMKSLINGNKLPFVNFDACLTGEFDQGSSDCLAEETLLNPNGGGVAVVASSRVAYGSWGASHINSVSGYLNVRLYHNYDEKTQVAGELLTYAKIDYLRNVGSSSSTNFKTLVEYLYFGDPSLLLGGLPTALFNIKCEDNTSTIKPGKSVEYSLFVENTDIKPRIVNLEVMNVPNNWVAKLTDDSLNLNPDDKKEVTLTVTSPTDAIANYVAKIKVIASLSNIARALSQETKTKVEQIRGLDIKSDKLTNITRTTLPEKMINFTFQVYNLGNGEDTIIITLESFNEDSYYWDYTFTEKQVILAPFSNKDVVLNIIIPQKTVSLVYPFKVNAKLIGSQTMKHVDVNIDVERVFGVDLSASTSFTKTDPGMNTTFSLTLKNNGNHPETFLLISPNLQLNWFVYFQSKTEYNDSFIVQPFSELKLNAIIYVPIGTLVGDYNITIMAQCMGINHVVSSSVELEIEVNRIYGVLLTSHQSDLTADPGQDIYLYLELENLGNDKDSVDIELLNYPDDWEVILDSQYNILLSPNGKRNIGMSIRSDNGVLMGDYYLNLRAILAGDNSISDLRLTVTINRIFGLNISNSGSITNITSDVTTSLPVDVTNLGNENDNVYLFIPNQMPDYTVTIKDDNSFKLKAYDSKEIYLAITAEKSIVAGEKVIPIVGRLEGNGENYTFYLKFNVVQKFGIDVSSTKTHIESQPGNEIKFEIYLDNLGNGEDTFTVIIEGIPYKWNVNFPTRDTVTMQPFSSITRTLYLSVPSDEPYHDVDIEVRVVSTNNEKVNDRLVLTTSIVEEKQYVMGMEMETFGIAIVVIIVIIILLAVAMVRRRRNKQRTQMMTDYNRPSPYSVSSDGSRVQWEEPKQGLPAQYNPPTPIAPSQDFVIQVQRPRTYLEQTHSASRPKYTSAPPQQPYAQYPQYFSDQRRPQLYSPPHQTPIVSLPSASPSPYTSMQDDLSFTAPKEYSPRSEEELIEQLDAEITAETIEREQAHSLRSSPSNTPEYHGTNEFSLNFKRPDSGSEN